MKELQILLDQAQKMEAIGTLAGGIAHDFNNILAAMIGNTELAIDDLPAESQVSAELKQVLKAGDRAKHLVRQILSFSRKAAHKQEPLLLPAVIKEASELLRASIPTAIEIRQELQDTKEHILADPVQIHQIIMNLCTNAAQAMKDDDTGVLSIKLNTVELSMEQAGLLELKPGRYQELKVSDTGKGMSSEILNRIFEPFFTTKGLEGTGMGLAVVFGIVKGSGGSIRASSEPGRGSTFTVHLPVFKGKSNIQTLYGKTQTLTGKERILLVDDEEALARLGKVMLERLGYKVVCFTSSGEALDHFKSRPDEFDLVITDYTMPQMTGLNLAEKLLQIRPDLPIILTSGYSQQLTEDKLKAVGIRRMIMKPLSKNELAGIIREILEDKTG